MAQATVSPPSPLIRYSMLGVFLLVCFAVAASGAAFSPDEWYRSLNRPPLTPPGWLFGPVWTALYIMMAVSGWLVWDRGAAEKRSAMTAYAIQLALNAGWSALFFGLHRPGLALLEICLLWIAIATTAWRFRPHSPTAAVLLLPYLGWVSFATYLNLGFWWLN